MYQLVLIHTVPPLVGTFTALVARELPGTRVWHVLDEPLLERVRHHGRMTDADTAALQAHVDMAAEIGADAVLVTCSTLSPGLDRVHADIPVVKIDAAMVAEAVQTARRIGVLATAASTLEPTRALLAAEAARQAKQVEIQTLFVEGALDALLRGEGEAHDHALREAIRQLAPQVDVIVLAQASMARALDTLTRDERTVPILTSPHTALARVRELLQQRGAT